MVLVVRHSENSSLTVTRRRPYRVAKGVLVRKHPSAIRDGDDRLPALADVGVIADVEDRAQAGDETSPNESSWAARNKSSLTFKKARFDMLTEPVPLPTVISAPESLASNRSRSRSC